MLFEQFKKGALHSFADCMREWVLVEGRHVCDVDTCMKFVKSRFCEWGTCPTLNDYHRSRSGIQILEIRACVLLEQRVYAAHGLGVERKMMNIFVPIRNESAEDEEICVEKAVLLFCSVVREGETAMNWHMYSS